MSIRIKLMLTYAILVIISTLVLIFSGIAIFTTVLSEASEAVLEDEDFGDILTSVIDTLSEVKYASEYAPEKLTDPEFMASLNAKKFYKGGMVVSYQGDYYNFSDLPKTMEFHEQLKATSHFDSEVMKRSEPDENDMKEHIVRYNDLSYFYIDFTFDAEGEDVTYFFIVDVSRTDSIGKSTGRRVLGTFVVIILLVTLPILVIVTTDIIQPIKKLEYGVKHIKNGDLNFKLKTRKNNEIGKVVRYFDLMREELKSSIDKQVKFEENRKELISSISHDLKTPITSIKGHVEGIRDGVANSPEKMDKYLGVIYQKSRDMDQLIDDLFLFSKLDLNRLPFEMSSVAVNDFMNEIVSEMQLGWEDEHRKLVLHNNLKSEEYVTIDAQKMRRVLINIIQNAMKYMDKEEELIDIHLTQDDNYIQIVVSDNGQGIDEEHVDHIFERFYRVDESRNNKTGGTGLGLAISKQIVEQHQGHIKAISELSKGTKIIVELKKMRTVDE